MLLSLSLLYVCLSCPSLLSVFLCTASVASHGGVFCVRRGREGGHGGLGGGEVQPVSDGVHHLQRDHPPKLPEGL